jgi:non-homologous end joining protein Ku
MLATTTTFFEQLVDQTTKGAEPTTSKDVVNMATMEMIEQEAPKQSLTGTLSEAHLSTG